MSKKSESPKTQTDAQESKAKQPSYWLTPEEIKALHEDARQSMELGRQLRKKKGRKIKPYPIEYQEPTMTGPDPVEYGKKSENHQHE
jgi:hypothetical protein